MAHVFGWTRRLATWRLPFLGTALIALALACRDDGPTSPLRPQGTASHATSASPSVEFYIHGSVEDWPVFMGNVAAASVQSGRKVDFIIATAGDAGKTAAFWQRRESASLTSIDRLLGTGAWTCASQTVSAHPLRRCTKMNVTVYFVRMPDGNYYDGTGYGFGSMSNLRDLGVATKAIDGSTTYVSWADFISMLKGIISLESQGQIASTVQVSAPDYDRTINPGDHPDNAATSDAVHAAVQGMGWTLALWVDYQSENMAVNLSQADHDTKQRLFLAYDSVMVAGGYSSDAADPDIAQWLWRTYYRVSSPVPPAAPTSLTGAANSKSRIDLQWVDNATNETGFNVERAPDVAGVAGTFAQIGTVAANATSYSDLAVAPGTRYWYRVRSYNDGATSAYSNLANVTTPTSQPLPYRGDAYIMAHQDDWQIFASDHTYSSFQNAASMLFVYTTAGDGGQPTRYWQQREKGTLASMNVVLGPGTWACANTTIRAHVIWRCTKNATVVYFMRMPDGNYIDGTGYGYGSITNLRNGTPTTALDGSTTYNTYSDFYSTLGAIVDFEFDGQSSPYVKVNAQEYDKTLDPKDHPDHNTTGDAVRLAGTSRLWDLTYYIGYDTENRPINITTTQHNQKMAFWSSYDSTMVAGGYASDLGDAEYQAWVWRTYFRSLPATSQTINAPTALTAVPVSTSEIDLAWTDNSTNETGFSIERAPDNAGTPGTFAVVATTAANATTYASTGLATGTGYWFRTRAVNGTGSSAYSNAVLATTMPAPPPPPPIAPSGLALTTISTTQINVAWTDNSSDENGFTVERAPDNAGTPGTYAVIATLAANVTGYNDIGLSAGTTYWYRVQAFNANGKSAYTTALSAATLAAPPAAPSALTLTVASSSQINLAWTDNSTNETGFSIERAPDNAGTPGTFAVIATTAANATSYSNTGLAASTTYWYRVQALGSSGNSAYSNVASAATQAPPPPAAPSGLALTAISTTQINLAWTDNSSNETGFSIERAPDNAGAPGTFAVIATTAANATSYSNTGLAASTTYWYRVQALGTSGNSGYSNVASAATQAPPPPAAPSGLGLTTISTTQINLAWTDNSSNETGFSIERAPDNAGTPGAFAVIATTAANVTSYSNSGLAPSTTYWYRVQALGSSGNSAYSNVASAATQTPPPPIAPSGLALTAISTTQINVAWTDNSSDESGFTVERAPDVAGSAGTFAVIATVAANTTSYSNTGLAAGTTYWYRVQAFNANGKSAYTTALSAATLAAPPVAPSGLTLTAASPSQINLAWTDNSTNETGFSIERAPDNAGSPGTFSVITTVPANTTSFSNTGLAASTTYWYRVQALGATGNSAYSNVASAATQAPPPPIAPSGLALTTISTTQINVAWVDNSSDETGFTVERAPDNAGTPGTYAVIATLAANVTGYADAALSAGTTYWYRVQAFNANGKSAYATALSAATLAAPPAAPSALALTSASPSQINLAWTDNSTNETGFSIERAPDNAGSPGTFAVIATTAANATSYSNTGLAASTTYWYRVQALGAAGNSAYSNVASAVTQTPPPPPPAAPSALALSVVSSSQIHLAWTDNSANESGFRIERAPDAGGIAGAYTEIATVGANVVAYDNTGLAYGNTYWFRVRAYNAGGTSSYSNESSATIPIPKPLAPTGLTATGTSPTVVALTWIDNATDETGYLVERAPDAGGSPGTFVQVVSLASNTTSWSDSGRSASTTYWYRVRAAGPANSDYSNLASATTTTGLPNAPSNVVAQTISNVEIDVRWTDTAPDETGVTVQRAPDVSGAPGTYATIATVAPNVGIYKNTGLTSLTTYWYRVRSNNAYGSSAWVETKGTTADGPPTAPSTLTAKPTTSATTAALAWKDNSTNEAGFRIEQAPDVNGASGTFAEIAVVGPNVTAYTASGLTGNTKYWYRVRAYNAGGNSAYSSKASVITSQPTDLTVDSLNQNNQIVADVEWLAATGGHVDVYRNGVKLLSNFTDTGSWYDRTVQTGITYTYLICNVGLTTPDQCSNSRSIYFSSSASGTSTSVETLSLVQPLSNLGSRTH